MNFQLHTQLAQDTYYLGDFPLCALLLSKDANYPWFILVPRQNNIREAFELTATDYTQLQQESLQLSQALQQGFSADKMNIAALGNMVPQLHLHHIVRYTSDVAWPNPVWGFAEAKAYSADDLKKRIAKTIEILKDTDYQPSTKIQF